MSTHNGTQLFDPKPIKQRKLNWSEAIARLSAHGGAGMFAKQIMREQGAAGSRGCLQQAF